MKSTRERILQHLLNQPFSSINELAESVGINAISVRHHLTSLQADGLVSAQEERHGVGRPRLVYILTDEGREKFPTRYLELTNRLIEHLKEKFSDETIATIFREIANNMVGEKALLLDGLPFEEKLSLLQKFMIDEGFSMQWEKRGEDYLLHQVSCPYFHVTQQHPEVCALGRSVVGLFLSIPTDQLTCSTDANGHCEFRVPSELLKAAS